MHARSIVAAGCAIAVVLALGATVLVPDWFGRPWWGWAALTLGAGGAAALAAVVHRSKSGHPGVPVSVAVAIAAALSGTALLAASIVRAFADGDGLALIVGVASFVLGGLVATGEYASAIGMDSAWSSRADASR